MKTTKSPKARKRSRTPARSKRRPRGARSTESALLSAVLARLPSPVSYLDLDLRIAYANDAHRSWFAGAKEGGVGARLEDVVGSAAYESIAPRLRGALGGEPQEFEADFPKDGALRRVRVSVSPDRDERGSVRGAVAVFQESSEDAQQANRYRELYECSPLGAVEIDSNFRVIRANKAAQTMLERSEGELSGKTVLELTHPEDRPRMKELARQLSRSGAAPATIETRCLSRSGKIVWVRTTWRARRTPRGQSGYVAAIEDVTAAKNTRLEADALLETMSEGFVVQGSRGRIEKFNREALRILGLSEDQLMGRTSMDPRWQAVREDGSPYPGSEHPAMRALATGESVRNAIMGLTLPTGESRWLAINAIPFEAPTERKVICTFRDITEVVSRRNELEKLLAEFQEAQSVARIGTWRYDLRTGRQTWSSEHYRIFEIPEPQPPEKLHQLYRSRIHPGDLRALDVAIERALSAGADFTYEHRVVLDGGARIKHVRGIGRVQRDSDGRPTVCSGTCQDLTDLVALQEQNRFVLDSMGVGIWKFNWRTQELFWDDSMYRLYEMDPRDFSGHYQAWESALSPEAKQKAVDELTMAIEGKKPFDTTFEIVVPSGARKQIGARGVVLRDLKNASPIMYGINWDRTKEAEAERQLRTQRTLLEAVLQNLPDMVFVKSHDDGLKFRYFNQAGKRLLGLTDDRILGKSDFDLVPEDQAQAFVQKDMETFKTGKATMVQTEPIDTPSGRRWLETRKVPTFKPDGSPDLLIGISKDVTEQLEMAEKLELERAKAVHSAKLASLGEMSAGVAHEINNPLAVILGNATLLEKHRDDPVKFASKVEAIRRSAERIEKIVKGLKKFARASSSAPHSAQELDAIVRDSLTMTEAKCKRHEVEVQVDVEPGLRVMGDAVELEQVVVNLVNNAVDAIKDSPTRWIRVRAFSEADLVVFRVTDSGLGVSVDVEKKLFQPFFTTKPVGEGTGLGLSIAKGILESHKASLELNRSFANTCFEIRFPRPPDAEGSNAA